MLFQKPMTSFYFSTENPRQYFIDLQHHFVGRAGQSPLVIFENNGNEGFAYCGELEPDMTVLIEQYRGSKFVRITQPPIPPNDRLVLRLVKTNAQVKVYDPEKSAFESSEHTNADFFLFCTSQDIGFEVAPSLKPANVDIQILTFVFTRDYLEQNLNITRELEKWPHLSNWMLQKGPVVIKKALIKLYQVHLRAIFETVTTSKNALVLKRDLYTFLVEILDVLRVESVIIKQKDWKMISEVHDLLLRDLTKAPRIDVLAKVAQVSVSKLKSLFKKRYGQPIYTYFLNARLAKAKALLGTGRYTVGQVSIKMGYSQPTKFIIPFKQRYKTTPFTFRKSSTEGGIEGGSNKKP